MASICSPPGTENKEEESDESEKEESEEDGDMACTGGCKGKWSQYMFDELDWNDDPLAEDGLCHTYALPTLYSRCVWLCSYRRLVLSGIVQCVQCHDWSHNICLERAAIHNGDQLAEWTCGKCAAATTEEQPAAAAEEEVNDPAIAYELHLALNCSSRSGIQHEDTLNEMPQMQGGGGPITKRQKR